MSIHTKKKRSTTTRIPPAAPHVMIHCKFEELLPFDSPKLKPHPQNPNHHSDAQLAIYEKVVRRTGVRRPVVISRLSGFINRGHGLAIVCARLKCPVPVEYQDFASEREELAALIADRKIPELAEFDDAAARELVAQFSAEELEFTGIVPEPEEETEPRPLVPLTITPPPTMAWALIGVPLERFAAVQTLLDQLPADAVIHTTANDQDGQP